MNKVKESIEEIMDILITYKPDFSKPNEVQRLSRLLNQISLHTIEHIRSQQDKQLFLWRNEMLINDVK